MLKNACRTIILVRFTNDITALWRCLCRCCRRFLNFLLNCKKRPDESRGKTEICNPPSLGTQYLKAVINYTDRAVTKFSETFKNHMNIYLTAILPLAYTHFSF